MSPDFEAEIAMPDGRRIAVIGDTMTVRRWLRDIGRAVDVADERLGVDGVGSVAVGVVSVHIRQVSPPLERQLPGGGHAC